MDDVHDFGVGGVDPLLRGNGVKHEPCKIRFSVLVKGHFIPGDKIRMGTILNKGYQCKKLF